MHRNFHFRDYARAFREHYPLVLEEYQPRGLVGVVKTGVSHLFEDTPQAFDAANDQRFVKLGLRRFGASGNALAEANRVPLGPACAYRGLMCLKPAYDLVAYCSLIWELQPKTIIEFGALQGGSALWFADQLEILCGHGEVHSFEKYVHCISPAATHPRLSFHRADFDDLSTLDESLFQRFEHPWLVVDDAHSNVEQLFLWMDSRLIPGDYYVIEDYLNMPSVEQIQFLLDRDDYAVDTLYADASGYNHTCAPNAWLRKG